MGRTYQKRKRCAGIMDTPNKYAQGSLWFWDNPNERKTGVQSGDRPVLVISNNTFNRHSPVINCLSITSVLKDSPVHVSLHINRDSHIQCEQLHTIPKEELSNFIGMVPSAVLSNVKAKIRMQFDMSEDKNTVLLTKILKHVEDIKTKIQTPAKMQSDTEDQLAKLDKVLAMLEAKGSSGDLSDIKTILELLLEKADAGFGIPEIEDTFLKLMIDLHNSVNKITGNDTMKPIELIPSGNTAKPQKAHPPKGSKRGASKSNQVRRVYTEEDIDFILDTRNTIPMLISRFKFKDRQAASGARSYFRKKRLAESV